MATVHARQMLKPLPVQPPLNGGGDHLNSPFDVPNFAYGESPPFRRGDIRTKPAYRRSRADGVLSSKPRAGEAIAPGAGVLGSESTGII
jgi:hypothetical protein